MELCEGEFLGGYFGIFNAGRLPNCWRTLRELIGWILWARGGQALLGRWVFGSLPGPSFGSKAHWRYRNRNNGDGRLIFCVPIHGSRRGNTSIDVVTASFSLHTLALIPTHQPKSAWLCFTFQRHHHTVKRNTHSPAQLSEKGEASKSR